MLTEFKNEPITDFTKETNKELQIKTISAVEARFGAEYPLFIGGKGIKTKERIASLNPSNPDEVVGFASKADKELAGKAVEEAYKAFPEYSRLSFEARAAILLRAANLMRKKRFELNAIEMLEAGKTWIEADADVAEAIDFCEFYAREALRYGQRQPVSHIATEMTELFYLPLGVVVVIPPWNFPLAITTGMTTAALVTGNTVVLKPASATPVIAWKLVEVLLEAGLPEDAIQFCPGSGSEVGDVLVTHPLTRMIAFTGSMDVGLRINELSAKPQNGQKWVKRVIAEMGGKDAIVVDETADLDVAGKGIVVSAFGFQGQKCSACSRAIIVDEVFDTVVEKVVEMARTLKVGDAKDPSSNIGPVITEGAMKTILNYIEIGKGEGKLLCGGFRLDRKGYFIAPTVFSDVKPFARIEQEEIFGPVLACIRAKDFDDALTIANDTVYGLTGAVFSNNRERLERARNEFFVGNLYFNRKCTGALVGVHPFGGFNMSGTDSKAGGRDYLLLFLQAKSVSEAIVF
jgi:1-pyrroline-5-carboxylate dehydrogenase